MRAALILIVGLLCESALAAPPAEADLYGLWKVTSYLRQVVGTDEITMPMGTHPEGLLELRSDHRALYIVTAEGRKPFSKPPTRRNIATSLSRCPCSPERTRSMATRSF